jgi:hypothetical protein
MRWITCCFTCYYLLLYLLGCACFTALLTDLAHARRVLGVHALDYLLLYLLLLAALLAALLAITCCFTYWGALALLHYLLTSLMPEEC